MKNNKKEWYGVYAANGLGIYNSYNKYIGDSIYIRGGHIEGFSDREEAESFAIDGCVSLLGIENCLKIIPESGNLKTNFFYFYKREGEKNAGRCDNARKS